VYCRWGKGTVSLTNGVVTTLSGLVTAGTETVSTSRVLGSAAFVAKLQCNSTLGLDFL